MEKSFQCAICSRDLGTGLYTIHEHPVLAKVGVCEFCWDYIADKTSFEETCSWCIRDSACDIYLCDTSNCGRGFCHNCIVLGIGEDEAISVKESETFCCYVCDCTKLLPLQNQYRNFSSPLYNFLHYADSFSAIRVDETLSKKFNDAIYSGVPLEDAFSYINSDGINVREAIATNLQCNYADRVFLLVSCLYKVMSLQVETCRFLDDDTHWLKLKADITTEVFERDGAEPSSNDIEAEVEERQAIFQDQFDRTLIAVDILTEKLDALKIETSQLLIYLEKMYTCEDDCIVTPKLHISNEDEDIMYVHDIEPVNANTAYDDILLVERLLTQSNYTLSCNIISRLIRHVAGLKISKDSFNSACEGAEIFLLSSEQIDLSFDLIRNWGLDEDSAVFRLRLMLRNMKQLLQQKKEGELLPRLLPAIEYDQMKQDGIIDLVSAKEKARKLTLKVRMLDEPDVFLEVQRLLRQAKDYHRNSKVKMDRDSDDSDNGDSIISETDDESLKSVMIEDLGGDGPNGYDPNRIRVSCLAPSNEMEAQIQHGEYEAALSNENRYISKTNGDASLPKIRQRNEDEDRDADMNLYIRSINRRTERKSASIAKREKLISTKLHAPAKPSIATARTNIINNTEHVPEIPYELAIENVKKCIQRDVASDTNHAVSIIAVSDINIEDRSICNGSENMTVDVLNSLALATNEIKNIGDNDIKCSTALANEIVNNYQVCNQNDMVTFDAQNCSISEANETDVMGSGSAELIDQMSDIPESCKEPGPVTANRLMRMLKVRDVEVCTSVLRKIMRLKLTDEEMAFQSYREELKIFNLKFEKRVLPKRKTRACLLCKVAGTPKWIRLRRETSKPQTYDCVVCGNELCLAKALSLGYIDVEAEAIANRSSQWWEYLSFSDDESDETDSTEHPNNSLVETSAVFEILSSSEDDMPVTFPRVRHCELLSDDEDNESIVTNLVKQKRRMSTEVIDLVDSSSDDGKISGAVNMASSLEVFITGKTGKCLNGDRNDDDNDSIWGEDSSEKDKITPPKKPTNIKKIDSKSKGNVKVEGVSSNVKRGKKCIDDMESIQKWSAENRIINRAKTTVITKQDQVKRKSSESSKYSVKSKHHKEMRDAVKKTVGSIEMYEREMESGRKSKAEIIARQRKEMERPSEEQVKPTMTERERFLKQKLDLIEDNNPSLTFNLEEGVFVRGRIAKHLKAHQKEGVSFMYKNIVKSAEDLKLEDSSTERNVSTLPPMSNAQFTERTGGCILAHCMGLGKTLQVISLLSAILNSSKLKSLKKPDGQPKLSTVLIVSPKNVIQNWQEEFSKWGVSGSDCKVQSFDLSDYIGVNKDDKRSAVFESWYEPPKFNIDRYGNDTRIGKVLIIGYPAICILNKDIEKAKSNLRSGEKLGGPLAMIEKYLFEEGPDILVVDEAHLLRNEKTFLVKAMERIKTKRRILLTGSPLQNNLMEYYVMVNYIRPGLLRNQAYFKQTYSEPIGLGSSADSNPIEVSTMKRRVHGLQKKIEPFVHRRDSSILINELQRPPQAEYVIGIEPSHEQLEVVRNIYRRSYTNGKIPLLSVLHAIQFAYVHHMLANFFPPCEYPQVDVDIEDIDAKMQKAVEDMLSGKNNRRDQCNDFEEVDTSDNLSDFIVDDDAEEDDLAHAFNREYDEDYVPTKKTPKRKARAASAELMKRQKWDEPDSPAIKPSSETGDVKISMGAPRGGNAPGSVPSVKSQWYHTPVQADDGATTGALALARKLQNQFDEKPVEFGGTPRVSSWGDSLPKYATGGLQATTGIIPWRGKALNLSIEGNINDGAMTNLSVDRISDINVRNRFESFCPPETPENSSLKKKRKNATRDLTESLSEDMKAKLEKYKRRFHFNAEQFSKLDIATLDIRKSGKLVILLEIIVQSILVGDKVVVFSKYTTVLNFLNRIFTRSKGWGEAVSVKPPSRLGPTWGPWKESKDFYRIDGTVSAKDRQARVNAFNEPGNPASLFMVSTKAGNIGINLVAANRVILVDTSWNPANDLQAMFRCYRFGQTKNVIVYRLICHKSIEEKIYMLQTSKRGLADTVVDGKHIKTLFSKRDHELRLDSYVLQDIKKSAASSENKQSESETIAEKIKDKKDGDLEPQVLEEDGLMNVLRRQKEMNMDECKEDALQDVVLASILQNHSSLVKTCHQNQTLLQHDPEQRLKPEEVLQAEWEMKKIEKSLDESNCPASFDEKTVPAVPVTAIYATSSSQNIPLIHTMQERPAWAPVVPVWALASAAQVHVSNSSGLREPEMVYPYTNWQLRNNQNSSDSANRG